MKLHEIQETNKQDVRQWIRAHTTYHDSTITALMTSHYYSENQVLKVSHFEIGGNGISEFSTPPFYMIVEGGGKLQLSDVDIENTDFSWLTEAITVGIACAGYGERVGDAVQLIEKFAHVRKLEQIFITSDYDKISNIVHALSSTKLHTLAFSIQGKGDEQLVVRKLYDHLQVWHGNKSMHPSDRSFGYDVTMDYVDEFELQDWLVNLGYSELV